MSEEYDGPTTVGGASGSDRRQVVISGVTASHSKVFVGVAEVKGDLIWQPPKEEFNEKEDKHRLFRLADLPKLQQDIGKWLRAPTYESDLGKHGDKILGHDSNPALWLFALDEFVAWRAGSSQHLWIAGRPGCGKSVIASSVINDLLDSCAKEQSTDASKTFVGYAFGSKTDDARKSPTALIKGILWQLATWKSLTMDQKQEIASEWASTGARSMLSIYSGTDQAEDTLGPLLRILSRWLSLFKRVYLVFDGLDECDGVETLLNGLIDLKQKDTQASVLVLSQPTVNIAGIIQPGCIKIDLDAAKARAYVDKDIQKYARGEIVKHGDDSNALYADELSLEIVNRSNGIFLWAVFATSELMARSMSLMLESTATDGTLDSSIIADIQGSYPSRLTSLGADNQRLLIKSINQLPRQMDSLFLYLLGRILRSDLQLSDADNNKKRNMLLVFLRWVFHSGRPMLLSELQVAMALPHKSLEDSGSVLSISTALPPTVASLKKITQICYPIVSFRDDKVALLHATFKDFVQPSSPAFSSKVVEVLGSSHLEVGIIEKCLTYLEGDEFDFFDFISVTKTDLRQRFPFLDYACASWVSCLKTARTVPSALENRIVRFLESDNAISWLENWRDLCAGDFSSLQTTIYSLLHGRKPPTWLLDLLARCVEERKDRDATDNQTVVMASALCSMYMDAGKTKDAYREFLFVYDARKDQYGEGAPGILDLKHELGRIFSNLGQLDEALECYNEIYPQYKELFGPDDEKCLITKSNIAYVYGLQGNLSEAEIFYRDCYDIRQRTLGERAGKTLDSATDLTHVLRQRGKLMEAREICLKTKTLAYEVDGEWTHRTIRLEEAAAMLELDFDNTAEALPKQRAVVEALGETLGLNHPSTMRAQNNLASVLETLAKYEEAGEILHELVPAFQKLSGPTHRMTLTAMNNLATNLEERGLSQESLELHRKILKIRIESSGRKHPDTLLSMNNVAHFFITNGPVSEAGSLLVEAFDSALTTLGLSNSITRVLLSNLTALSIVQNCLAAAQYFNDVHRKLVLAAFGEKHSDFVEVETLQISILKRQGSWKEARKIIQRCLKIAQKQQGIMSEKYLEMQLQQAAILREFGLFNEAEKITREVLVAKESKYGVGHRFTLRASMLLGILYTKLGELERAFSLLSTVYKEMCDWSGVESKKAIGCSVNLAEVHRRMGSLQQAELLLRRALEYYIHRYGPKHEETALIQERLALVLFDQEEYVGAEELQRLAWGGWSAALAPTHPFVSQCKGELARTLYMRGNLSEASKLLPTALDGMKLFWTMDHPNVQSAQQTLKKIAKVAPELMSRSTNLSTEMSSLDSFYVIAHRETLELLGAENRLTLQVSTKLGAYLRSHGDAQAAKTILMDTFTQQVRLLGYEDIDTLKTLNEMLEDLDSDSLQSEPLRPSLTSAINARDVILLERLVRKGALTSIQDRETSWTPLALSIQTEQVECAKVLIEHGANVNHIEHNSERAIHVAARKGSLPILNMLLEYGAELDACSTKGKTALWIACEAGHLDIANRLLSGKASTHSRADGIFPLHAAALQGHVAILKSLLDANADIECAFNGGTPLYAAAIANKIPAAEYLCQRGASVNAADNAGMAPLHEACRRGYSEMVKKLLENSADLDKPSAAGYLPIHYAVESGDTSIVELLSRAGADIFCRSTSGKHLTPLAKAASCAQDEVLQWLLDKGADANEKLDENITALFFAGNSGTVTTVEKLLGAGANVNTFTTGGQQPIHEAVIKGNAAITAALIQAGASTSGTFNNGITFLIIVIARQQEDLFDVLVEAPGIDVDAKIPNGLSPLHLACFLGLSSIATKLLNHGARINCQDIAQETPLHLACQYRKHDLIPILLRRGADKTLQNYSRRCAIDYASEDERVYAAFSLSTAPFTLQPVHYDAIHSSLVRFAKEARVETDDTRRIALFSVLARCLCDLGSTEDGRIAREQCITVENEDRSNLEHDALCDMCPSTKLDGITGTAYFCRSCSHPTSLCSDCMAKYSDSEHPAWCYGHEFVTVPREVWKTLQPLTVDEHGQTVEAWLTGLEDRFRRVAKD